MLEIIAALALAAALLTGTAPQSGDTTSASESDPPIIVHGGAGAESDPPIIVHGGS